MHGECMASKKTDPKEVHVSIRLKPELHARIVEAVAKEDSRSLNWFITKAIAEKLDRKEIA
jgi:predicted HicB family RNase H-like nuclease